MINRRNAQSTKSRRGLFRGAQICPALIWCKCLVRLYERMGFALIFKLTAHLGLRYWLFRKDLA